MIPHLSWSQANTYLRCNLQWEARYIRGEKRPPGVSLLVGSSVHVAAEADLLSKMHTGELLHAGDVEAVAADSLARRWSEEPPVADDDDALDQGAATDLAVSLSRVYHRDLAPAIEPVHVERELRMPLPVDGPPLDLLGRIDVQEAGRLRDLKTAGKSPGVADLRSTQFGAYAALIRHADGSAPPDVSLDALVKTRVPKAVTLSAPLTGADADVAVARLAQVARAMRAGIAMPADPTSWVCTPKWCGWYDTCPHGARKVVSAQVPGSEDV